MGPLSRLVGKPPLSPWVSADFLPLTQVVNNTNSAIPLTEIFDRVFSDVCNSLGFEVQKQKKRGSGNNRVYRNLKGAVYTVWIFICICMSLRAFLFAKKMKFLTKGGIHCISQVFPWHFYFMREHSLVELTEHDDSAANIIVHCMYIHIYVLLHS